MRVRGRVLTYSIDIQRDYSELYELGRLTPIMMPGPRRLLRLEVDVTDIEGEPGRGRFGYADINIVIPDATPVVPVFTQAPPARVNQVVENIRNPAQDLAVGGYEAELMTATGADLNRIADDIGLTRRMEQETDAELRRRAENAMFSPPGLHRRIQESLVTSAVRRGGPSPIEEGPGSVKPEPPKPEEPKEPTRWSMLEID